MALLGVMVVVVTAVALMVPAISMTRGALVCGLDEHKHSDECYEFVIDCGLEENEHHKHDVGCYKYELVCGKDEHVHTDACYENADASKTTETNDDADGEKPMASSTRSPMPHPATPQKV